MRQTIKGLLAAFAVMTAGSAPAMACGWSPCASTYYAPTYSYEQAYNYAPAYGGFCGYAASVGKVRPADPLIWSIVDGQLILQHTKGADELWKKDVVGNKAKADKYWPHLIAAKAGKKDPVDSLLGKSVLDLAKID